MAYDEALAQRVREVLAPLTAAGPAAGYEERKMFGGLAFMVRTHMACGIMGADAMVRVGKDQYASALARGAGEMRFTGKPMRGFVTVPGSLRDEDLASWVAEGVSHAQALPPKGPKA